MLRRTAALFVLRLFLGGGASLSWATTAPPHCPSSYARFHEAHPDLSLSTRLMLPSLHLASQPDKMLWYESSVQASLRRSLQQQLDWSRHAREGLRPGERVYWMQQSGLKDLNERYWDIGGTEYFLQNLDKALGDVLAENPQLGRIIHRNYKDRVIVSSLSPQDFQMRVVDMAKARLARTIKRVRETPDAESDWLSYMNRSMNVAHGRSLVDAHLSLKLRPLQMDFAQWRERTTTLRNQLELAASARGLEWPEVLREARRTSKGEASELDSWLAARNWPAPAGDRLREYLKMASVADFLPTNRVATAAEEHTLREILDRAVDDPIRTLAERGIFQKLTGDAWDLSRSLFLEQGLKAHYMAATDIEGLGARGLLAQDAWIAKGADPATLEKVYEAPSAFLDETYQGIEAGLRKILGPDAEIHLYRSGDDGLWALPEMTARQYGDVRRYLAEHGGLYSHVEPIQDPGTPLGVARAVSESRDKLFSSKHAAPETLP